MIPAHVEAGENIKSVVEGNSIGENHAFLRQSSFFTALAMGFSDALQSVFHLCLHSCKWLL